VLGEYDHDGGLTDGGESGLNLVTALRIKVI
jgi:hypothetical protein